MQRAIQLLQIINQRTCGLATIGTAFMRQSVCNQTVRGNER